MIKPEESLLEEDKKEKFSEKLDRFCKESSVLPITRIYNGTRVQQLAWGFLFVSMTTMFALQFKDILVTFFSYPSNVDVRMYLGMELYFPAITVCNLNPARVSIARKWQLTDMLMMDTMEKQEDDLFKMASNMFGPSTDSARGNGSTKPPSGASASWTENYNKWEMLDQMNSSNSYYNEMDTAHYARMLFYQYVGGVKPERRGKLAHQLNDLIMSCKWLGYQCSPRNFSSFLNTAYGMCHTFNSARLTHERVKPDVLTVTGSGSDYALQIEFNVEQEEYINTLSPQAGIRIQIHDPERMPFPKEEGFSITPGYLTSVGIKLNRVTHLPAPWGDCEDVESNNTLYGQFGATYSIQACLNTCFYTAIRTHCNCSIPGYPRMHDDRMCEIFGNHDTDSPIGKDMVCFKRHRTTYKDSCSCPRPCHDNQYDLLLSSSAYPSNAYKPTLQKTMRQSSTKTKSMMAQLSTNIAKLEVYMRDMQYTNITSSKSYMIDKFLSDLGGLLGLWLGFSAITIAEFGEFFIDIWGMIYKKCCRRKKDKWPSMTALKNLDVKKLKLTQVQPAPAATLYN